MIEFTTVDSILKLNGLEKLFIEALPESFNEEQFMRKLQNQCDFNFIVKISENSSFFNSICRKEKYRTLWNQQLFYLAKAFSDIYQKEIRFYEFSKTIDVFSALKGIFFFLQSQEVCVELCKELNSNELSFTEEIFLKKAIEYGSIHAIQRYNNKLYKERHFEEIIGNCKKSLKIYGSYAYMMLAEAYFRYAQFLMENTENIDEAHRAIAAAINSCQEAKRHLGASQYSIHNASFGEGLKTSNSMGFEPDEAIAFLEDFLAEKFANHSSEYDESCVFNYSK